METTTQTPATRKSTKFVRLMAEVEAKRIAAAREAACPAFLARLAAAKAESRARAVRRLIQTIVVIDPR